MCGDQQPRQRARQSWSGRRAAGTRDRANQLEESGSGDGPVWGSYCDGCGERGGRGCYCGCGGLAASVRSWVRGVRRGWWGVWCFFRVCGGLAVRFGGSWIFKFGDRTGV